MTKDKSVSDDQIHDQGVRDVPGDQIANAAAESLHSERAREETYEQPDSVELPAGTLIAKPGQGDDA